jgi:uncharacterized membrane protein YbhN (UPF0104 family)
VLSSVDWATDRLLAIDPRYLAGALAFQLGIILCRGVAWRNALQAAYPGERIALAGVAAAYAVGVALNGLLPARGGEAAKIALVRLQLPRSSVAAIAASASVILLLDTVIGAVLIVLAVATGATAPLPAPPRLDTAAALATTHPPLALAGAAALVVLAWLGSRLLVPRLRGLRAQLKQGLTVLRTPGRYLRTVALPQLGAWACRVGVVLFLLAAFGLPATIPVALLVIVLGGLSTAVPAAPGGLGTQQVLLVYALRETASAAVVLSFSLGMQAGVTIMNTLIGLAAAMLVFRTVRPLTAVRSSLALARNGRAQQTDDA